MIVKGSKNINMINYLFRSLSNNPGASSEQTETIKVVNIKKFREEDLFSDIPDENGYYDCNDLHIATFVKTELSEQQLHGNLNLNWCRICGSHQTVGKLDQTSAEIVGNLIQVWYSTLIFNYTTSRITSRYKFFYRNFSIHTMKS